MWHVAGRIHYMLAALSLVALAGCLHGLRLVAWQL
jgi:hypothetical protein